MARRKKEADLQKYVRALGFFFVTMLALFLITQGPKSIIQSWVRMYEDVMLAIQPSAERAMTYGDRHFSSMSSSLYDIDRADAMYAYAYDLAPHHPFLNHQRARVAFLRGDLHLALNRIDRELEVNPEPSASTHYMRGLILGYMGRYDEAVSEYEEYLAISPYNWAGLNDYAWVLLKANRPAEALGAIDKGLIFFPENPWLLNTKAIALHELNRPLDAKDAVMKASMSVQAIQRRDWLVAYPGNDPKIAGVGIETLMQSIEDNMHTIDLATVRGAIQSN